MTNNQKPSRALNLTAGLLAGVVLSVAALSAGYYNFQKTDTTDTDSLAFITQQFVNWGLNGGLNGPNANVANALWWWTLRFNFVMLNAQFNNAANPANSSCTSVANIANPGIVPGKIDFVATTNPNPAWNICGLMNANNQIVQIANINQLNGNFANVAVGNYRVVCVVKANANLAWQQANFCQSAVLNVQAAVANPGGGAWGGAGGGWVNPGGGWAWANPVNPNAIDVELQGAVATLANGDKEYTLRVFNNPANAWAAAGNFSLRVYPQQGLNNIVAPLAAQITPMTVFFKVLGLGVNQTVEYKLTGTPAANGGGNIVAELCDYNNPPIADVDSQPCSIFNLNPNAFNPNNIAPNPAQDDEGKR